MRWIRFTTLVLIIAFFQASRIFDWIALTRLDIKPDILLVMLVFFGVYAHGIDSLIAAFSLGLVADIISPTFGPYIMAFGLCGSALSTMPQLITIKKPLHVIAAVFFTGLVAGVIVNIVLFLKGQSSASVSLLRVFGCSAYSALLAPYVFAILLKIVGWMGIKKYQFAPR